MKRLTLSSSAVRAMAAAALAAVVTGLPAWPAAAAQTLRHPLGFRAELPAGWSAVNAEDGATTVFVVDNPGGAEAYVLTTSPAEGVQTVTDPASIGAIEREMRETYPGFQRVAKAETLATGLGPGLGLAWEGRSPSGIEVRLASYITLHAGNAVTVIAVGEKERVLAREAAVRRLFTSLAPERTTAGKAGAAGPAAGGSLDDGSAVATQWRARLSGKKLTYLSSYGSGSAGGYTSERHLFLLPDGRFVFRSSSSVAIYVDGANGGSSGRQASEGRWRVLTRNGVAMLELSPSGGQAEQMRLESREGKTFLNGSRWFVTEP